MRLPSNFSVEERESRAMDYFRQGYNCCQSVVMAFSDITGLDAGTLATIASGFGGGMGRLREMCGAFSGMVALSGFISPAADPSSHASRTANYALVQEFASEFRSRNGGSIVCRDLLGLTGGVKESPAPSQRTSEYYKKRPCAQIVGTAAALVAEYLLKAADSIR